MASPVFRSSPVAGLAGPTVERAPTLDAFQVGPDPWTGSEATVKPDMDEEALDKDRQISGIQRTWRRRKGRLAAGVAPWWSCRLSGTAQDTCLLPVGAVAGRQLWHHPPSCAALLCCPAVDDIIKLTSDPVVQQRLAAADSNQDGRISRRDILCILKSEASGAPTQLHFPFQSRGSPPRCRPGLADVVGAL